MASDLTAKIIKADLRGRGGAGFPVALKWQAVKDSLKKDNKTKYYLVVNAAEGEPGVRKDAYILENYPDKVLEGIYATISELNPKRLAGIYFYTSKEYYKLYSKKINKLLNNPKILSLKIFWNWKFKPKVLSYVGGEETTALNIIEGRRHEPRLKPPLPVSHGLFGMPTLVNNVETFYDIALVGNGSYESKRFYTISGGTARPGVYHLPTDWSIEDVLRLTGNWPSYKFFVQIGGDLCGEFLSPTQLQKKVSGSGSITIYSWFDKNALIKKLITYFKENSCGKCTPCREGTYRLLELNEARKNYSPEFWDILDLLENASFCAYGRSLVLPLSSFYKNILNLK